MSKPADMSSFFGYVVLSWFFDVNFVLIMLVKNHNALSILNCKWHEELILHLCNYIPYMLGLCACLFGLDEASLILTNIGIT
jgi:hypothetical protein